MKKKTAHRIHKKSSRHHSSWHIHFWLKAAGILSVAVLVLIGVGNYQKNGSVLGIAIDTPKGGGETEICVPKPTTGWGWGFPQVLQTVKPGQACSHSGYHYTGSECSVNGGSNNGYLCRMNIQPTPQFFYFKRVDSRGGSGTYCPRLSWTTGNYNCKNQSITVQLSPLTFGYSYQVAYNAEYTYTTAASENNMRVVSRWINSQYKNTSFNSVSLVIPEIRNGGRLTQISTSVYYTNPTSCSSTKSTATKEYKSVSC